MSALWRVTGRATRGLGANVDNRRRVRSRRLPAALIPRIATGVSRRSPYSSPVRSCMGAAFRHETRRRRRPPATGSRRHAPGGLPPVRLTPRASPAGRCWTGAPARSPARPTWRPGRHHVDGQGVAGRRLPAPQPTARIEREPEPADIMIRDSDNEAAVRVLRAQRRPAGIERMIEICGLTDSHAGHVDGYWSNTVVSARDVARGSAFAWPTAGRGRRGPTGC